MRESLLALGMIFSFTLVGILFIIFVLTIAAVPISAGPNIDAAIAQARNAAESAVNTVTDYATKADAWWRDSAEPGPK